MTFQPIANCWNNLKNENLAKMVLFDTIENSFQSFENNIELSFPG